MEPATTVRHGRALQTRLCENELSSPAEDLAVEEAITYIQSAIEQSAIQRAKRDRMALDAAI
jgi:hypothetical protein